MHWHFTLLIKVIAIYSSPKIFFPLKLSVFALAVVNNYVEHRFDCSFLCCVTHCWFTALFKDELLTSLLKRNTFYGLFLKKRPTALRRDALIAGSWVLWCCRLAIFHTSPNTRRSPISCLSFLMWGWVGAQHGQRNNNCVIVALTTSGPGLTSDA